MLFRRMNNLDTYLSGYNHTGRGLYYSNGGVGGGEGEGMGPCRSLKASNEILEFQTEE